MKKIITFLTIAAAFLCICFVGTTPASVFASGDAVILNDETGIPDKGLYQVILDKLGKEKNETFTKSEAESITDLIVCNSKEAKTLKGIGYLTNMKSIMICDKKWLSPRTLEELAEELPWLEWMEISDNEIESIKPLASMKNLRWLNLEHNRLSSLEGVEGMAGLEYLNVESNRLADIEPLKEISGLKSICLNDNRLSSLEGMECHTGLTALEAEHNYLTNLKGIEKLENLTWLSVSHNKLSSLRELKNLRNLKTFVCSNNDLKTIKDLKNSKKLQTLILNYNKISNVDILKEFKNLDLLYLSYNRIKRLPDLKNLKKLYCIELYGNFLTKKEIDAKLPKKIRKKIYQHGQETIQKQNFTVSLVKPKKKSKITKNTKQITGRISVKKYKGDLEVFLELPGSERLKKTKVNKNGDFVFKKLNLKKYAGKTMELTVYGYDVPGEERELSKITFKVKK